jgi:hypothetical protein
VLRTTWPKHIREMPEATTRGDENHPCHFGKASEVTAHSTNAALCAIEYARPLLKRNEPTVAMGGL